MTIGLGKLLGSRTFKSFASFASSGLSFAAANVIFANQLSVPQYGMMALLIAIIMLAATFGMMGADGIVNRHAMTPDAAMFGRVILTSTSVGLLAALLVSEVYGLRVRIAALLVPTVVAFSLSRFCGAFLQSRMRMISSLALGNSLNYLLLGLALSMVFVREIPVFPLMASIALLQCFVAAAAVVFVRTRYADLTSSYEYSWRESFACILVVSSLEILVQLDRLLTPRLLSLHDLAVLGVLLAIVGPPFRLMYLALGYDLLPTLRRARAQAECVSLLVKHLSLALLMIVPLWVAIWYGAPLIQHAFLPSAYELSAELMLAALVAGTIKAFSGIAKAAVTALGSIRSMEIIGTIGWISVVIGVLCAWHWSRYGLAGVVYGVGFAWLVRLVSASWIVAMALKRTGQFADSTTRFRILVDESTPEG